MADLATAHQLLRPNQTSAAAVANKDRPDLQAPLVTTEKPVLMENTDTMVNTDVTVKCYALPSHKNLASSALQAHPDPKASPVTRELAGQKARMARMAATENLDHKEWQDHPETKALSAHRDCRAQKVNRVASTKSMDRLGHMDPLDCQAALDPKETPESMAYLAGPDLQDPLASKVLVEKKVYPDLLASQDKMDLQAKQELAITVQLPGLPPDIKIFGRPSKALILGEFFKKRFLLLYRLRSIFVLYFSLFLAHK